jgi:hypothetical protein
MTRRYTTSLILDVACSKRDLELITYIYNRGYSISNEIWGCAIQNVENTEVLPFLYSKIDIDVYPDLYLYCIEVDNIKGLIFLENIDDFEELHSPIENCIKYEASKCFAYLISKGIESTCDVSTLQIREPYTCLCMAAKLDHNLASRLMILAIHNNDLKAIKKLHNCNVDIPNEIYYHAARFNRQDIILYSFQTEAIWTPDVCERISNDPGGYASRLALKYGCRCKWNTEIWKMEQPFL